MPARRIPRGLRKKSSPRAKTKPRRVQVRRVSPAPITAIPQNVLDQTAPLLEQNLDTLYGVLGAHLSQVENPAHAAATYATQSVGMTFLGTQNLPTVDYKAKAYAFLKEYWKNIIKESCGWWKNNKDQTGKGLIGKLAVVIAVGLPPPWNLLGGVLAVIAVILIKAGLDTVCQEISPTPPSPT